MGEFIFWAGMLVLLLVYGVAADFRYHKKCRTTRAALETSKEAIQRKKHGLQRVR